MFFNFQNIWIESHFKAYLKLVGRKEEKFCCTNDHIDLSHLWLYDYMIFQNEVMINEKEK